MKDYVALKAAGLITLTRVGERALATVTTFNQLGARVPQTFDVDAARLREEAARMRAEAEAYTALAADFDASAADVEALLATPDAG